MHYGALQGFILHQLFIHLCFFSVQLSTKKLWGITTWIILQHSFFPDMSCSSPSCCAGERALITHKFLIKNQYWVKMKCYFANCMGYTTAFSPIYILFLIHRTITLLAFLCLLLFSKKSLTVSLSSDMAFSSSSIRPNWIPRALRMAGLLCPHPLPVVCVGLHQSCWSTQCQKGLAWGWTGHTVGMCLPQHAGKSWYHVRLWAVTAPCSSAGAGCFVASFEPFLSYLVCIFWILWICILRTWAIGSGFQSRWFIQSLSQSAQSFFLMASD